MKKILILIVFAVPFFALSQKTYSTKSAKIKFFSHTVAEDAEATNSQSVCTLNDKTGAITFLALVKGFKFENNLMEQHFNDAEYMNSTKFPKSTFAGTIANIATVNFTKNGTYNVTTEGTLTMHGVAQKVKQSGTLVVANGKISLKSVFKIKPKAFGIKVPEGISDDIEITVTCSF